MTCRLAAGISASPAPLNEQVVGPGERWVAIWTRCAESAPYATRDGQFTAAIDVDGASGCKVTVFGSVLPWRGSTWEGHPSAGARAYAEALRVQQADWADLVQRDRELCVTGDFNQDLSDVHYDWSRCARETLEQALRVTPLHPLTGGSSDPVRRLTGGAAACIDHVCATPGLATRATTAVALPSEREGRTISDHPLVMVTFADV